jgi:hypothetical protein
MAGRGGGKKRIIRNEVGKGSEKVIKQNNLTPQDAVNRKIWQKVTEYLYPVS